MADLAGRRQRLEIWCGRCGRCEQIPPARAVELLGANTTFPMATERLTCSACGARGREKWIHCRPSVEDFYASLEGLGGLKLPGKSPGPAAPPSDTPAQPDSRTPTLATGVRLRPETND